MFPNSLLLFLSACLALTTARTIKDSGDWASRPSPSVGFISTSLETFYLIILAIHNYQRIMELSVLGWSLDDDRYLLLKCPCRSFIRPPSGYVLNTIVFAPENFRTAGLPWGVFLCEIFDCHLFKVLWGDSWILLNLSPYLSNIQCLHEYSKFR